MASVQPVNEIVKQVTSETDSGDESDDAYDNVIEVSPCGRWEKRRIEVRNLPFYLFYTFYHLHVLWVMLILFLT